MQVQSVDNSTSNVRFKSRKNIKQVSEFVNMDDAELMKCAYIKGHDEKKDKRYQRAVNNSLFVLPLVDTLASGATVIKSSFLDKDVVESCRKMPLSVRTVAMTRTAALWTAGIAAVGLYSLAKKAITNNSESAKNFEHKNPLTSFMIDIGILSAGFIVGQEALRKAVTKYLTKTYEKDPKAYLANAIKTEEKLDTAFSKLDKTFLNKKVLPKFEKWSAQLAKKAPFAAKTARFAVVNSIWILLGLGIAKSIDHANKENNRVERNYINLKNKQLEASKYLNATLGVENDILAQDNHQLASDLRATMNASAKVEKEAKHARTPETQVEPKHETKHKHEHKAETEKTKIIIIENEVPAKSAKNTDKADKAKTKAE